MKPPRRIKVGPHDFKVLRSKAAIRKREWLHKEELYGETNLPAQEIIVHPTQGPSQLRDTVLHEVLHACAAVAGGPIPQEDEERFVRPVATVLLGVLRDNPKLVAFLTAVDS